MIGEQVGDYRVVSKLGAGGMGVVYGAEHALLGRPAAIKILHPSLSSDREIVQRFFNEARAASAIRHPGIVDVYTFGYHTDGTAYIAMAYLDGESLEHRIARLGRLPDRQALRIAAQIAGALGAAHSKDIVHRDLKPDNVFIVPDADMPGGERIQLLDFGIAKLAGEREPTGYKTKTGAVFGTPAYMSPEQCRGAAEVDHRSDLYALGCILYRMVCSRVPFESELSGDVLAAQIRDAPPPPRQIDPSISVQVEQVILQLLQKKPEQRYQSAREVRSAIAEIVGESTEQPAAVVEPSLATADTVAPSATTLGGAASEMAPSSGRRAALWGVAAGALGVAAAASIYFAVSGDGTAGAASPDAAVVAAPSSDAGIGGVGAPDPPPRIAATDSDCRSALSRAAALLAGKVPAKAVPYVYMQEYASGGARAEELVIACTIDFDQDAARCIASAESAAALARCGDDFVIRECARGDTDACGSAASIAFDTGQYARARTLARATCEQGGKEGCVVLGVIHFYGRGAATDYKEAFRNYSAAAGLGDPGGAASAAAMLRFGVGVERDEATARQLYEESCSLDERGNGCVGLGDIIFETRRKEALEMFDRTCKAGRARGCVLLADHEKAGSRRLYERARSLYEPLSEQSPYAARRLGELIRDGKGGKKNPGRALELFRNACDDNEPFACEALGDLLVSGGVKLDLKSSRDAYDKACGAGLSNGCERAECQRLFARGRSDDAAWNRRVRKCRESGALGPTGVKRIRRSTTKSARPPGPHGPRQMPDDPLNGLDGL